jgi:hypothetical protein
MARFTLKGDQRHVDLDSPIDEAPSPPIAPAPHSATPEDSPPLIDTPSPSTAPTFSGLGTTFNNSIQSPVVGLPQTPSDQGSQGINNVNSNASELTTVHNSLLAEVSKGQLSGAALGHVQAILSDINTAISTANATVNSGTFGSTAAAEQSLRADHLDIINAANTAKTDVALTNLAIAAAPDIVPEKTAADAPHANLAEIGAIFNDAADKIISGVNDGNRGEISTDLNAVITDMEALIKDNPKMFEGSTGQNADAVVRQLQLELTYINDPNISPDAARASVDNILDIIGIIQGDPKLADMATQDGISGFAPIAGAANPASGAIENDVQTVFAAGFIAQSNSLGHQAIDLVGSGDVKAIATLIADLKAFEKFVADFDAAQGGNALLDATGALSAEVAAIIKGLQTGDANLVTAVADQMHGNAAGVAGGAVSATGAHYNTDGVTVTEVLGTAPVTEASANSVAATEPASADVATHPTGVEPVTLATTDVTTIGSEDHTTSGMTDLAHHLHHTWG